MNAFPFPVAIYDTNGGCDRGERRRGRRRHARQMRRTSSASLWKGTVTEEKHSARRGAISGAHRSLRQRRRGEGMVQVAGRSTRRCRKSGRNGPDSGARRDCCVRCCDVSRFGYLSARSALQPVERIARTASEIEASDLRRRSGRGIEPEEVQKLADTFDAMLERLEAAFGAAQLCDGRFARTADAAHRAAGEPGRDADGQVGTARCESSTRRCRRRSHG